MIAKYANVTTPGNMQSQVTYISLLLILIFLSPCIGVWVLPMYSKICENDVIKSIANYSLVQCIASCRRSNECQTVFLSKNEAESIGKCLHLKESNGSCRDQSVVNSTSVVNITKNDALEKTAEGAESGAKYRVKSGLLHKRSKNCFCFTLKSFLLTYLI